MPATKSELTYRVHRRSLIRFVLFLLTLLVVGDVTVILRNHTTALELNRQQVEEKLSLAGDFCVEAILKNDYVAVEQFLLSWAKDYKKVLSLKATTANNFPLVDFAREHNSNHTLAIQHQAKFQNKIVLTIEIEEDLNELYKSQWLSALSLIGVSIIIVIVFGVLLWNTLRKTAFLPLQNEITERKKIQQDLTLRGNELEVSNKELEAFCYSVSHDLRSPLRGIHGFSSALYEDYNELLDDPGKDHLKRICDAANRMSLLIDVLLEMSRVSRQDMKVTTVNLSKIATEILTALENNEPKRNVTYNVQPGIEVEGDPALLHIILNNLLSNAWKYSRDQEQAIISFEKIQTDTGDVYCVMDNGAGFDMAYANKLFVAFQRLHRQDEFEGTGVGLATVKRIVHRHHGQVWAESEKNKGAKFCFSLWDKSHS